MMITGNEVPAVVGKTQIAFQHKSISKIQQLNPYYFNYYHGWRVVRFNSYKFGHLHGKLLN